MIKYWLLTISTPYLTEYYAIKSENKPKITRLANLPEVDEVIDEGWLEYEHIEEVNGNDSEDLEEEYYAQVLLTVEEMAYEKIKEDIFNGEEPTIINYEN